MRMSLSALVAGALVLGVTTGANATESVKPARLLTEAELDQVRGGAVGQGVATSFTEGGTANVLNAFPGLLNSTTESGLNPTGHGQITAGAAPNP
jgi:hypothetical protein